VNETLATLRRRGTELLAEAEEALKYHNWERVTARAAYIAVGNTPEKLTEIEWTRNGVSTALPRG
jgi:hypothetical protein